MDVVVFEPQELIAVTRALRDIAVENGSFTDAERDLVDGIAAMHGVAIDPDALEPISLEELARVVVRPHARKRAVQLAMVVSLVEEGASADGRTEAALEAMARALDVTDAGLRVLRELAAGQVALARFDMGRRLGKVMLRGQTAGSIVRAALPLVFGLEDSATAARYAALEHHPAGSFGRALFDHYREHGFSFPGEKGGMPERGIFHDAGHVLSGYGVDPAGEIQQAAFQAGFIREDGFAFFLFALLQFHLGVRLTPIAKGEVGYFDVPKVLRAARRGASCNVDLSSGWDFWSVAAVPLEELRARYGIPPV